MKYMRRVNPNRVHLSSDLTIDKSSNSIVSYLYFLHVYIVILLLSV